MSCYKDKNFNKQMKSLEKESYSTEHIRNVKNRMARLSIKSGKIKKAIGIAEDAFCFPILDDDDLALLKTLGDAYKLAGRQTESLKCFNGVYFNTHNYVENSEYTQKILIEKNSVYKAFLDGNRSVAVITEIINENIALFRITEAVIFYAYLRKIIVNTAFDNLFSTRFSYAVDFINDLLNDEKAEVSLISDSGTISDLLRDNALSNCLGLLGIKVKVAYKSEGIVKENAFADFVIAIEQMSEREIEEYLVEADRKNISSRPIIVIGNSYKLQNLAENNRMYRYFEMFYRHYETVCTPHKDCILFGDFYKTSSYLYKTDTQAILNRVPKYDYTILIPVRNSAKYLEFALKTCLNVKYKGKFEILISDNSDKGNSQIENCIKKYRSEFADLNYIRAPFRLSLAKSFEFAYLQAQGKRIISLGSDDGVLPDILSRLDEVFDKYPNPIVHFEGVNYCWPEEDSLNGWLFFRKTFLPNNQNICEIDMKRIRNDFVFGNYDLTILPIMYLHNCIEKSVITDIINSTGKFEFGGAQDTYTGVINSFLYDKITYTDYPLFIIGASNIGVGRSSVNLARDNKAKKIFSLMESDYRYLNYYHTKYFKSRIIGIYISLDAWFIYQEFVRIRSLNIIKGVEELDFPAENFIAKLNEMYKTYSLFTNDINILYKQTEQAAATFGSKVYGEFLRLQPDWIKEREMRKANEKKLKTKIKRSRLVKKLYSYYIKFKSNMRKKETERMTIYSDNEYSLKRESGYSLSVNGKDVKLSNIFEASIYADKWLKENLKI